MASILNFSCVEKRLDELASFRLGEKPCFSKGDIQPGTSHGLLRAGANLFSFAGSYVGCPSQWSRTIEELTPFIGSITRFFTTEEFKNLDRERMVRLSEKTQRAMQGLEIMKKTYQAEPKKIQIIDQNSRELSSVFPAIEERIAICDFENPFAPQKSAMFVVRHHDGEVSELREQNIQLLQENKALRGKLSRLEDLSSHLQQEIRALQQELQIRSKLAPEVTGACVQLTSALSAFSKQTTPQRPDGEIKRSTSTPPSF
jgi:hypothetical protein